MKGPIKQLREVVGRGRAKVLKGLKSSPYEPHEYEAEVPSPLCDSSAQNSAREPPKEQAEPPSPPQYLALKDSPPESQKQHTKAPRPLPDSDSKDSPRKAPEQHVNAPSPPRYSGSVREWVTGSGTLYEIHDPATNIAAITTAICTAACAVPTLKVGLVARHVANAITRIPKYLATVPSHNARDVAVELMKIMNKCMVAFRIRHASPARRDRQLQKALLWDSYRFYMSNLHMAFPNLKPGGCLNDCLVDIDKSTEAASIEAAPVIADAIQTAINKVAGGISLAPNHHREAIAERYTSYTRQIADGIAGGIKAIDKTIV
jgi:hypothetical protein